MLAFAVILFLGRCSTEIHLEKQSKKGDYCSRCHGRSLCASPCCSLQTSSARSERSRFSVPLVHFGVWDGTCRSCTDKFGFGIYVDHITVMLLFVASFLCLLINISAIGYMNTDPINDNRNHRFYAEFVCSARVCSEWFLPIPSFGCSSSGN